MSNTANQEIAALLNVYNLAEIAIPSIDDEHVWPELRALHAKQERQEKRCRFRRNEDVIWRDWIIRATPSPELDNKIVLKDSAAETKYEIEDIQEHEMPVIGTYVDSRIVTGFRYKICILGTRGHHQFEGKALKLMNIGKGYGKRLTFHSISRIYNDNYFWSDNNSDGYAFRIIAVCEGDKFDVYRDDVQIGHIILGHVSEVQREISHTESAGGGIEKRLAVSIHCNFKANAESDDSFISIDGVQLDGVVVTCNRHSDIVIHAEIPVLGKCILRSEALK